MLAKAVAAAFMVLARRGEPADAIVANCPENDFGRVAIFCHRCNGGFVGSGSLVNSLVLKAI